MARVKGTPIWTLRNVSDERTSADEDAADCTSRYNALSVQVIANGASPSAALLVQGSPARGGRYTTLSDPNATKTITASGHFHVVVGSAFAKAKITPTLGTFTVVFTPFRSPAPTNINARVS